MDLKRSKLFLGVDGGQSHTEAVIADGNGNVLGRGYGGPSNHAEQPGGRKRLRSAVVDSVASALAGIVAGGERGAELLAGTRFRSAHFGMTGGADFKEAVIEKAIDADQLTVGHDAPTALFGATGGEPGVVVIAGTGSVVFADDGNGKTAQVGGLGYVFADEGSGFWLAAETIRMAIKENDGVAPDTGLSRIVLDYFSLTRLKDLADGFYNGVITRDEIARFSLVAHEAAVGGNSRIGNVIETGARVLAEAVATAARRVGFGGEFLVSCVGGMFKGSLMQECFRRALCESSPRARLIEPVFGPAVGALLIAYKQAGIPITPSLANSVKDSQTR